MDITTCSRGQYFGELALVTNKPRAASAYAVGSVKCLGTFFAILWLFTYYVCMQTFASLPLLFYITLPKLCLTHLFCYVFLFFFLAVLDVKAFERLLGPCMDIMKRNIANYEEQLVTLFGSSTGIEQQSAWEGPNGPWIGGWKKRLVWMFFPRNHVNSFSYKKCEYPLQNLCVR